LVLCALALLLTDLFSLLFSDAAENSAATVSTAHFAETITALINDVGFRIGAHTRARALQSAEPYVLKPVLEPGTMFLMGSGLLGISVWARRRWVRRRR
jgi:hypothetical protein